MILENATVYLLTLAGAGVAALALWLTLSPAESAPLNRQYFTHQHHRLYSCIRHRNTYRFCRPI